MDNIIGEELGRLFNKKEEPPKEKTKTEIIARSWISGDTPLKDAQVLMAMHTADTLHDHPIRQYPQEYVGLADYIENRLSGSGKREQDYAKKNGNWIYAVIKIQEMNYVDIDYLNWSAALCERNGAMLKAEKIKLHLLLHLENNYPEHLFKQAIKVQAMDSYDRPTRSS